MGTPWRGRILLGIKIPWGGGPVPPRTVRRSSTASQRGTDASHRPVPRAGPAPRPTPAGDAVRVPGAEPVDVARDVAGARQPQDVEALGRRGRRRRAARPPGAP